jgi:hypothetical protein
MQHLHDRQAGIEADEVRQLSGPIGWLAPSRMAVSMLSTVPTPSYSVYTASLIIGTRMRFTMKAG